MKMKLLILLFVPISCIAGDNLNDAYYRAQQAKYVQFQQEKVRNYLEAKKALKQELKKEKKRNKIKANTSITQLKHQSKKNKWYRW